jgi:hypothetical protein
MGGRHGAGERGAAFAQRREARMPSRLPIYDESVSGERTPACTLDFLNERITVRELIRERVYQEVREFNATEPETFRGLVQPTDTELTLNGYKIRSRRRVDWEEQFRRAVEAFECNGFFILIDDRQAESLDEELLITPASQVSFVKLVPLVGG